MKAETEPIGDIIMDFHHLPEFNIGKTRLGLQQETEKGDAETTMCTPQSQDMTEDVQEARKDTAGVFRRFLNWHCERITAG